MDVQKRGLQIVLMLVPLLGAHAAMAAMRCGTNLVSVGDLRQDVLARCGVPVAVEGDKWIYDQGSDEFTQIIQIRDEKVLSIEEGGYGTPDHGEASQ